MLNLGTLTAVPVSSRPDLVAPAVAAALRELGLADRVGVVEIDPSLSDTAATAAAYAVPAEALVNCVVVAGKRHGVESIAACLVQSHRRADVNGVVRRLLDVRKASFLPQERAVALTGMEYGGITAFGLTWPVLIDQAAQDVPVVLIGSGVRRSKLVLPGAMLAAPPGAHVVPDLGRPT